MQNRPPMDLASASLFLVFAAGRSFHGDATKKALVYKVFRLSPPVLKPADASLFTLCHPFVNINKL
jgi:hypothetical protein